MGEKKWVITFIPLRGRLGASLIPVLHINMDPLIRLVLTGATAGLNVACKVGLGSGSGSGCGSGSSS